VPYLWALSEPEALIYLAATLETVRRRRGSPRWPAEIYRRQLGRLNVALAQSTIYLDTDRHSAEAVHRLALAGLHAAGLWPMKDPSRP
jgi:hypothetical protein